MRTAAAVSASRTWLASAVPRMFWFELALFQIDSYEALQSAVKEKQINKECVVTDFQWVLFTDKGQVFTELQKEVAQVYQDRFAQFLLRVYIIESEEFDDAVPSQQLSDATVNHRQACIVQRYRDMA